MISFTWTPSSRRYELMLRERRGLMLTLAWATIFLIIGLAVAVTARHQTGKLVGSGLSLLGILLFILALYLIKSYRQPTEHDSETIAEKYRI